MPLVVICNPACGAGDGYTFVRDHVLPVLDHAGKTVNNVFITERTGHAGEIVVELLKASSQSKQRTTVILSSGDGTLHEIVNAVYSSVGGDLSSVQHLAIVLVPSGTANALFSSLFAGGKDETSTTDPTTQRMAAVQQFIEEGRVAPLTLAKSIVRDMAEIKQEALSVVVTSTALHASILHDSEALRSTVPDMSRFKMAAAQNIKKWYYGTAKLLPLESGEVLRHDSDRGEFVPETAEVEFNGPFTYFLSTVNVDRLEPQFCITPLQKSFITRESMSMDVIMLRPMREEGIEDNDKGRETAAESTIQALSGAYRAGAHVGMRFSKEYNVDKFIAEYFRCGGWQWNPDKADEYAHLLCCDGTIFHIPSEGAAICKVLGRNDRKFLVY
ncbi:hypothetical protein SCHPADRAFT_854547, partial [Schizopora paradoxa]